MSTDTDGYRLIQNQIEGLKAFNAKLEEERVGLLRHSSERTHYRDRYFELIAERDGLKRQVKESVDILKEFVEGAGDPERWLMRCDAALEKAKAFLDKENTL